MYYHVVCENDYPLFFNITQRKGHIQNHHTDKEIVTNQNKF